MKKVKFITGYYIDALEMEVNEFLASHDVLDIQFQFSGATTKQYSVMIIYEEYLA